MTQEEQEAIAGYIRKIAHLCDVTINKVYIALYDAEIITYDEDCLAIESLIED